MATKQRLVADGSSVRDAPPTVEIDLEDELDRMRYRCPVGHTSWSRTNSHIWCRSCARADDLDPEHYEIVDEKTGETIPWSAVRVV